MKNIKYVGGILLENDYVNDEHISINISVNDFERLKTDLEKNTNINKPKQIEYSEFISINQIDGISMYVINPALEKTKLSEGLMYIIEGVRKAKGDDIVSKSQATLRLEKGIEILQEECNKLDIFNKEENGRISNV